MQIFLGFSSIHFVAESMCQYGLGKKKERYEHSMFALGFALQPGTETPQGSSSAGKDFALTLVWGVLPAGLACLDTPARIARCSGSPGADMQDVCVSVCTSPSPREPGQAHPAAPLAPPGRAGRGWAGFGCPGLPCPPQPWCARCPALPAGTQTL